MKLVRALVVLTCLCSSLCSCSQLVSIEPSSVAVATNGSVTLQCNAPSSHRVIWRSESSGEEALENSTGLTLSGSELSIGPFHGARHEGLYTCEAELEQGAVLSCPARVSHARIGFNFTKEPANTESNLNSITVLECRAPFSIPRARVTWKHNGNFISFENDMRRSVVASGNLYIVDTQYSDAGQYQCIATNEITAAKRRSNVATLRVNASPLTEAAPQFTITPHNVTVVKGEPVSLECAAVGVPVPVIGWVHFLSAGQPPHWTLGSNGVISTDSVQEEDAGLWRCDSENSENSTFHYVHVTVKVPPSLILEPPAQSVQSVTVGNSLTLSCTVTGSNPVQVEWYQDTMLVALMEDMGGIATLSHTLSSVGQSDSGIYQCKAYNDLGCVHDEIVVMVTEPADIPTLSSTPSHPHTVTSSSSTDEPTITPSSTDAFLPSPPPPPPPSASSQPVGGEASSTAPALPSATPTPSPSTAPPITALPITVTVHPPYLTLVEGSTVMLTCIVDGAVATASSGGAGDVVLYWTAGGQMERADILRVGGSLISKLSVGVPGTYDCVVVNVDGSLVVASATVEAALIVVTVPDRALTLVEGDTASLQCLVEGAGPGAMVTWSLDNKDALPRGAQIEVEFDSDKMEYQSILTLDPVREEHGGYWQCVVESAGGQDHVSGEVKLTIRAALPTSPPRNVTVRHFAENGFGILVSWQPADSVSRIIGYKLTTGPARPGLPAVPLQTTNQTEFLLVLNPFQAYTLRLWAYTLAGDGPVHTSTIDAFIVSSLPPSPTAAITTPPSPPPPPTTSVPSAQLVCEALNSSTIHLTLPFFQNVIREVELRYGCRQLGGHVITRTVLTRGDIILTRLLPGCDYDLSVLAISGSSSDRSAEWSCQAATAEGPFDVQASVARFPNRTVAISWHLPPELQHRPVTVEVRIDQEEWQPVHSASHILSDLATSEEYDITLRFSYLDWEGTAELMVPPLAEEEGEAISEFTAEELGIIYGVVFGLLLVVCGLLLAVILALKYKQIAHRESDKITNHRQERTKSQSLDRSSSIKSIQKISLPSHNGHAHNGHAHTNLYTRPSTDV